MKKTTLLILLFVSLSAMAQTSGRLSDLILTSDTVRSTMSFLYFDSLNGKPDLIARYNITDDKWILTDTMATIKFFYKNMQFENKISDWYEERIDLMYWLWNNRFSNQFQKKLKKLHNLERNRPIFKP